MKNQQLSTEREEWRLYYLELQIENLPVNLPKFSKFTGKISTGKFWKKRKMFYKATDKVSKRDSVVKIIILCFVKL